MKIVVESFEHLLRLAEDIRKSEESCEIYVKGRGNVDAFIEAMNRLLGRTEHRSYRPKESKMYSDLVFGYLQDRGLKLRGKVLRLYGEGMRKVKRGADPVDAFNEFRRQIESNKNLHDKV